MISAILIFQESFVILLPSGGRGTAVAVKSFSLNYKTTQEKAYIAPLSNIASVGLGRHFAISASKINSSRHGRNKVAPESESGDGSDHWPSDDEADTSISSLHDWKASSARDPQSDERSSLWTHICGNETGTSAFLPQLTRDMR